MTCRARGGELGHWQWEPALALALALAAHLSEMTWVATVLPSACCRRAAAATPAPGYATLQHHQAPSGRITSANTTRSSMSHHQRGPRRKRKQNAKEQDIQGQPSRQVYSTQSVSALHPRPQDGAQPRVRFDVGHDKIRPCVAACAGLDVSRRRLGYAPMRISCVVCRVSYNCASEVDLMISPLLLLLQVLPLEPMLPLVCRVSSLKSASLVV